jgi:hypothetical protein
MLTFFSVKHQVSKSFWKTVRKREDNIKFFSPKLSTKVRTGFNWLWTGSGDVRFETW